MSERLKTDGSLNFIEDCLKQSQQLALVTLSHDFIIESHNPGFSKLFGVETDLVGKELKTMLLPESQTFLTDEIAECEMPIRLNFIAYDGSSASLDCRLNQTEHGFLLFGDHITYIGDDTLKTMTIINNEMAALTRELNRKNKALIKAQAQIRILSGIIPICMYCKEIRDDSGYWNQLEKFISEHSEAEFSHGICDKCLDVQYSKMKSKTTPGV